MIKQMGQNINNTWLHLQISYKEVFLKFNYPQYHMIQSYAYMFINIIRKHKLGTTNYVLK